MDVGSEIVDANTPDGEMAVLRTRPASDGASPRVLVVHDGPGIRTATREFSAKLAAEGYEVIVPDLHHRHGRLIGFEPHERAADPSLNERMRGMVRSMTDANIQTDIDAALGAVGAAPDERLGVIGFCLGARGAYRALMRAPERFVAGAMWHPSFLADDKPDSPHLTAGDLAQPLFIGVGDADQIQPIAVNQPFFDAVDGLAHVTREVFPGADHAYTWPDHPTYDERASTRSWAHTTTLFEQHLRA